MVAMSMVSSGSGVLVGESVSGVDELIVKGLIRTVAWALSK